MAILNTNIPTNLTEYPNSFKRQGAFPLEAYSIFYSLREAEEYATNSLIAYVGQILTVINNTSEIPEVKQYSIINEAGVLKELGKEEIYVSETNTDNNSIPNNATIEIVLDGTTDEEFININDYYKKSETYSKDEVDTRLNNKADKSEIPTSTSELNKDDVYTKDEVYTKEEVDAIAFEDVDVSLDWNDIQNKPNNLATTDDITTALEDYAKTDEIPTDYVPNTRTINNQILNDNIVLEANDIGTYTKAEIDSQLSEKVNMNTVISIEKGGTDATTAEGARANLGAAYTFYQEVTVSNTDTDWSVSGTNYRLDVACDGVLSADTPIVDVATSVGDKDANKLTLEAWSHIVTVSTAADGHLNIFADEIPSVSFTMRVKVVR